MNEAELLFTRILDCDRFSLYLNKDKLLKEEECALISSALERRMTAEPIQYILGTTEFMGFEFNVTPDVLIPRPETEILVETVIKYVSGSLGQMAPSAGRRICGLNILDIGTGSGNIAISLAKLLKNAKIFAVDISDKAINVARNNAVLNKVEEKISFINSDFFNLESDICNLGQQAFDIIVSNPPYIPSLEIDNLQPEIKYEPRIALDGGDNGLDFYRKILKAALRYLKIDGFLILEIGYNQKTALESVFEKFKQYEIIEFVNDHNNLNRLISARRKS